MSILYCPRHLVVANRLIPSALGAFTPPAFENIMWKTYLIFGIFGTCARNHLSHEINR